LQGWKAVITEDKGVEEIALDRAKICDTCEDQDGNKIAVKGKFIQFLKDDIEEIQGMKCSICQCPISAKTRSKNSKCPIGKW